jgi:hypothetical protein
LEENDFRCTGRFAGAGRRRSTPGGMVMQDITLAVLTEIPWKQKRVAHIGITCWGDQLGLIEGLRTGAIIQVKGLIEDVRKGEDRKLRLVAKEINLLGGN